MGRVVGRAIDRLLLSRVVSMAAWGPTLKILEFVQERFDVFDLVSVFVDLQTFAFTPLLRISTVSIFRFFHPCSTFQ